MSFLDDIEYDERYYKDNIPADLLQLSIDLMTMLRRALRTDIVLNITGPGVKYIKCHKAILCIRSKWFSQEILQRGTFRFNSLLDINENFEILKAVLLYIYTGDLLMLESLCIPLIDLQNAAEKYGLTDLKKLVTDVIKSDNVLDKTNSIQFMWSVEVGQNNCISAVCPALQDFTLNGSDKWGIEIQPLTLGDETCVSEFYLTREVTNESHNITHTVNVSIYFMKSDSSTLLFSGEISASENGKYKLLVFSAKSAETENLSNTTITLSCELKVYARVGVIENFLLKGMYRRHIYNEFYRLSQDMRQMLNDQRHTDMSVKGIGPENAWRLHSYMVFGRISLPIPLISKFADLLDFSGETWRTFIFYLYTGQTLYLDDHMRAVYNFFKTLSVREPANKYQKILANNLNLGNAFGILCDSIANKSNDLMRHTAEYLASNSGFLSDPEAWIKIATETTEVEIFGNGFN